MLLAHCTPCCALGPTAYSFFKVYYYVFLLSLNCLNQMNTKKKRVRRLKEDYKKLDESWDKVLLKLIPDEPITALSEKEVAEVSSMFDL